MKAVKILDRAYSCVKALIDRPTAINIICSEDGHRKILVFPTCNSGWVSVRITAM